MSVFEARDEAKNSVEEDVLLEFTDYVVDRASRRSEEVPYPAFETAADYIFQLDADELPNTQGVTPDQLEEPLENAIYECLDEYWDNSLFTVDLPHFSESFERRFIRRENKESATPGFKEFYKSPEGDWMAFVPKDTHFDTKRDKAEQVMTMIHNSEVIESHGYSMPCEYKPTVAEKTVKECQPFTDVLTIG